MTGRRAVRAPAAALFLLLAVHVADAADTPLVGDDRYRFLPGASEERAVPLAETPDGARLLWPGPAPSAWDTALLGVRVRTELDSIPHVELRTGAARVELHLDPGAQGLRWLNLTGLRAQLAEGAEVSIRAHGVALEPGTAALRVFANRLPLDKRILILAPHPDDAEIAAFGLYAGREATIVTVTSGNAGDANYKDHVADPAEHYLLKGYLRAFDSVTVPWQGGIPPERCYNLGYFDARLHVMRERPREPVPEMYGPNQDVAPYRRANVSRLLPNGPRQATWANLVEDLVQVFRKVKPDVVVMPYPQLDTHADHQFVSVAAVDALERWKGRPRFLLYTNHAAENRYPFGPAGTSVTLPPWPGPEITVQGIYAHPVSPALQLRKLFALESMHDLRLSPAEQDACGIVDAPRRPDYPRVPAVDYFRRGPRAEELFFVFDREAVRDVVRAFLASWRPPPPAAPPTPAGNAR